MAAQREALEVVEDERVPVDLHHLAPLPPHGVARVRPTNAATVFSHFFASHRRPVYYNAQPKFSNGDCYGDVSPR